MEGQTFVAMFEVVVRLVRGVNVVWPEQMQTIGPGRTIINQSCINRLSLVQHSNVDAC
jgi:hypothetical protein